MINLRQASLQDDKGLCCLLRQTPMYGHISLRFETEPSFYGAMKHHDKTLVAIAENDSGIFGMGAVSLDNVFIDGNPVQAGYLHSLRFLESSRSLKCVAKLYGILGDWQRTHSIPVYYTTVLTSNKKVRAMFERGGLGVPKYTMCDTLTQYLIHPRYFRRFIPASEFKVVSGKDVPLDKLIDFVDERTKQRNLSPVLFTKLSAQKNNQEDKFNTDEFIVAIKQGKIEAVALITDDNERRQTIIHDYSLLLKIVRPIYNISSGLFDLPKIPSKNSRIEYNNVSFFVAESSIAANAILTAIGSRSTKNLSFCLCSSDPLKSLLDSIPSIRTGFTVYTVGINGTRQLTPNTIRLESVLL